MKAFETIRKCWIKSYKSYKIKSYKFLCKALLWSQFRYCVWVCGNSPNQAVAESGLDWANLMKSCITGVMAASEIPPQMANFQTFSQGPFFPVRGIFRHFAHCYFVLNFSLSAQKQHNLVMRNTPNCSSVHSGMTGISLSELALHNRCDTACQTSTKTHGTPLVL